MIKNESDIIESFVRINLRVVDELHIVDDGSIDRTVEIIRHLRDEGLNVNVFTFPKHSLDFQQQSLLMTSLLKQLSDKEWDYAVFLDADEFILAERDNFEADLVSTTESHYGLMQLLTYVPISSDYFNCPDPLHELFRPRPHERPFYKVVVPRGLASDVLIWPGNHSAARNNEIPRSEAHRLGKTRLAHVPVRSANQIVSKALVGAHTLSLKKNRQPGEGTHWDYIAKTIREKAYELDLADLQEIAFGYTENDRVNLARELQQSPLIPSVGKLKYVLESSALTIRAMDDLLMDVCHRYASLQRPSDA